MITVDTVVVFSLGSFIGFITSELVKDRLARNRNIEAIQITEFNKAAAVFTAAFLDDVIFLEDTDPKEVSVALLSQASKERRLKESNELKAETSDTKHRKAMIMFRPYIAKSDLTGFDAAWSAYHEWPLYYGDEKNKGNEYDFKSHLLRLLEYAKPR